jgi:16S rRNA (guanine966-N2)-methyltransferase
MRIVGGKWRGRALVGPAQEGKASPVRPTSDRLREALFNVLAHAYDDPVRDARVLDLFAGTGALGLESLSRGAAFATFVDEGAEARGLVRQNVEALGAGGVSRLFRRDATRLGAAAPNPPVSLVFCDPPYGKDLAAPALLSCRDGGWLAPNALIVVEESVGSAFAFPEGFAEEERRRYGETEIAIGRLAP